MKILYVIHAFLPESVGGLELHVYRLAKEISKTNQVMVFCKGNDLSKDEYEEDQEIYDGIKIKKINYTWRDFNGFKMVYINERIAGVFDDFINDYQPDVVDIHHLAGLSTTIIESLNKREIPQILTLHDYWMMCPKGQRVKNDDLSLCAKIDRKICTSCMREAFGPRPRSFMAKLLNRFRQNSSQKEFADYDTHMRKMINLPDTIITPSEFHGKELIAYGVKPEKLKVISYGYDTETLKTITKTQSEKLRFGFIGSVIPTKGVHVLVEAFNMFERDDVSLSIYGEVVPFHGDTAYGTRLKNLVKFGKDVHFLGRYESKNLQEVLSHIDVLVVPSIWYECSPFVIREGLLAGIPVITSNLGGMKELIEHEKTGLLFKRADPNDLYKKMKMLVEDRALMERLSNTNVSIKHIRENTEELLSLYKELVVRKTK